LGGKKLTFNPKSNDSQRGTEQSAMSYEPPEGAKQLLEYLYRLTEDLQKARSTGNNDNYQAYLHGQLYGAALALRLLFPGPGRLGEQAALLVRPIITEHNCQCDD